LWECDYYGHPSDRRLFNGFFNVLWDTMFKYKQIDYDKYYKPIEDYAEKDFFKLFQEEIKNEDILDFCE
ncbi:6189_t:CDS:2, partial [Dentiscutata heterogama]